MLSRHPFALAVLSSLAGHAALVGALIWSAHDANLGHEPYTVVDVDLDVAPAAPKGFDPLDRRAAILIEEAPPLPDTAGPEQARADAVKTGGDPAAAAALEPAPKEEKEQRDQEERERRERARRAKRQSEEMEKAKRRAEEAAAAANRSARDAGVDQVQSDEAGSDLAGSEAAQAGGVSGAGGAGSIPTASDDGSSIGATASSSDPGPAEGEAIPLPPGASADLRTSAPEGDRIAVLLRYDRLRGTPWAALADAIIAPMPDYRAIIGNRQVALADMFQWLFISSRNPRNVTATNLVARTQLGPPEMRRFLDHPLQRVTWHAVRGGMLGKREASELKLERDGRVYLVPFPGLVLLTSPRHLGVLAEVSTQTAADGSEIGTARASDADIPAWLARARSVDNEAGVDSHVIVVATVGGLRAAQVAVPPLGVLPTPERLSLALEMATIGFYVRGTLAFASPELAEQFETRLMQARQQLLGSRFSQLMLQNLHAFHALQGLALRRRGPLVTYATSISNADAKAGMKLAAEWARRFFEIATGPLETRGHAGATTGGSNAGVPGGGGAPSTGDAVRGGGNAVPGDDAGARR